MDEMMVTITTLAPVVELVVTALVANWRWQLTLMVEQHRLEKNGVTQESRSG